MLSTHSHINIIIAINIIIVIRWSALAVLRLSHYNTHELLFDGHSIFILLARARKCNNIRI